MPIPSPLPGQPWPDHWTEPKPKPKPEGTKMQSWQIRILPAGRRLVAKPGFRLSQPDEQKLIQKARASKRKVTIRVP